MKNIVTALMQFVILVIALVIVTFAIPKIAGNDDRYDKYIAENSKQIVTVGSAFGVVKDGEKASYTDIDNSLKNIFSKVTPLQKPVNKILNRQISFKQAKYFEYYWLTALISGVLCWIFAAGFPFRIGRKGFNVFGSVYNNFSKVGTSALRMRSWRSSFCRSKAQPYPELSPRPRVRQCNYILLRRCTAL